MNRLRRPSTARESVAGAVVGLPPRRLALAQAAVAWAEAIAAAGLGGPQLVSRLVALEGGVARVAAHDPLAAGELRLRADQLRRAVNAMMAGRPGAGPPISEIRVVVAPRGEGRSL